jgi:predicted nucleic acid-binding protein
VKRPVLLDASFLIDFERETAQGQPGPAHHILVTLRHRPLVVSIVTVEEILEGADDDIQAMKSLQRFSIQGIQLAHARRCALLQRRSARRLGENDAWLVATAVVLDADVVGADRRAFDRLGSRYLRFR